jgi:signal peptide peptidase SppA
MTDALFEPDAATMAEFQNLMADPAARQAFVEAKAQAAKTGAKVRYSHVLRAVSETPWAIKPAMLAIIVDLIAFRVAGGRFSAEELEHRLSAARRLPQQAPDASNVAVLGLQGVIIPKASAMSDISGGTSLDEFRAGLRQSIADPSVKGIVMDIDSPGGMVSGVPEMAAEIRASRKVKPIVAIANHEAASAAYWLGAQADRLYMTKSATVGSIGVYTTHENRTGEAAAKGVERTLVSAGKYKTEGNPYEPLSDDARQYMQSMVDEYYGYFLSDVAAGRGAPLASVRSGFGEGRVVMAKEAIATGMVDGVSSLEAVVAEMLAAKVPTPAVASVNTGQLTAGLLLPTTANTTELPDDFVLSFSPEPTAFDDPVEDSTEPVESVEEAQDIVAEVDNSAWDGNRAMGQCSSAADYRSICAGEKNVGDPDERQHWALPHHYLGRGPNAAGVRNALARLGQTEGLTNRGAAQAHLDAHMRTINPQAAAEDETPAVEDAPEDVKPDVAEDVRRDAWEEALADADTILDKKKNLQKE